ncbi:copper resistance CopC family protein [Nonomuraea africana]|uniref:Methionine-rich copper-binding protein CopC n=1 Tax=Nonomuraea africana TaxID=46171 RepID=A0ABR9KJI8_9ACTN|nr:copper resistance CopC family protein [Nonomuraea africana]MBE1561717.1 methionine-rich copper-binding protein CopC [Nonomuraea africana]
MNRSPRAALTALLAALVAAVVLAPPALAHDALKSSNPKKNATVKTVDEIELEFTAAPKLPFVIVRAADDTEHQLGKPEVDGPVVTQKLKGTLPDGSYTIAYRVVSSDGHPIEGEIPFKVKGAPQATPTEEPTVTPTPAASESAPASETASALPAAEQSEQAAERQSAPGFPIWLILVVGGLVGVGIGFLLSARKKKP